MIIKCPTCRIERVKPRHVNLAYKINMPLLRALDAAILEEEESFNKIFKYDLNLIECQLCKMRFKTISELQHHIIGDNIVPACSEIKIICIRCRISKPRRMIFNLICNDCDNLIIN